MRFWQEALVSLVCLLALGCRTDPNIVLLERENRELQDTIYELQDCLDKYQRNLEACQQGGTALQENANGTRSTATQGPSETAPQREPAGIIPRRKSQPAPPVPAEQLQPPQVELPTESSPTSELPETLRAPATTPKPASPAPSAAPSEPAGPSLPEGFPLPMPQSSPAVQPPGPKQSAHRQRAGNAQVAEIKLDPRGTGGYDQDGRGGDDGITVMLQARDAQGRPCHRAAPISVVVLDPALPGDAARIARWDFTAAEVAAMLKTSSSGEGIRLTMPWPQAPPVHRQLQLFVRYTTDNGRKLQTESPIGVALDSQQARDWAPALLPTGSASSGGRNAAEESHPIRPAQAATPPAPSGLSVHSTTAAPALEAARPAWSPNRR